MAESSGTLESLAAGLARVVRPLEERLASGQVLILLAELGYPLPAALEANGGFGTALTRLTDSVKQLLPQLTQLIQKIEAEDEIGAVQKAIDLGRTVVAIIEDGGAVANAIKATPHPGISNGELDELPRRLVDYLLVRNVEAAPLAAELLELFGLFQRETKSFGSETVVERHVDLGRLSGLLSSPGSVLKSLYGWGNPGFDGSALLQKLQKLLTGIGIPAIVDTGTNPPALDLMFAEIQADTTSNPPGLKVAFADAIGFSDNATFQAGEWKAELKLDTEVRAGLVISISPDGGVTLRPTAGEVRGDNELIFTAGSESGPPYVVLGEAGGSRVEARQLIASFGAGLAWQGSQATGDFSVGAEVRGAKVVIDFSKGDGFLAKLLSGVKVESGFDLGLGYSGSEGVHFHGSATLEVQLPIHADLGPVSIDALTLGVGIEGSRFPIGLGLDIKGSLGPLQLVVEQIGLTATLVIVEDGDGLLGPLDLEIGFKPPVGVGIAIDAGAVSGGGYLRIDVPRGEYAGVLQLSILDMVSVSAIGVITTKMPDGSKGFSFIAIISVEFNPGIQLGFGFTLLGVGGLVGLNRTMELEAIAQGARNGSIDTILFPKDVIANAPRIISDLRAFFPPEEGTFLIGPMMKLGWGTPTLISLALGIIIEIPGNIAIVGKLTVAIPDERLPLIIIQVAFIGAIEFDKKRGWFFAVLYESRVIYIPLDGGMGMFAAFGSDSNFVVSVGGFHPAYDPPSLPFPPLSRIAMNILNTPVARIRVQGYFAVTSNTVQFGASIEVYFGISIASVEGHLAFDALFQFSPFYFIISISASLSVKLFGFGLFSVRFRGSLEGTSPWHVEGTGSISLLFWDVDVDFSHTWGDKEDTSLPPISVLPILAAEFAKLENWTAKLDPSARLLVSLRPPPVGSELVLHPTGSLSITQRAIPLGLTLDKVGAQKPDDANRFTIAAQTIGIEKRGTIRESFAMGQFQNLKDAERLSAADYEKEDAGLELSVTGNQLNSSYVAKRIARYEEIIVDNNYKRVRRLVVLMAGLFAHFLANHTVARADISAKTRDRKHLFDEKVEVHPNAYVVVNLADNAPFAGAPASFASRASAREFMAAQAARNPDIARQAHIVRPHEMRQAA